MIRKIRVATGITWVEIPEADLFMLCGCPADSVKHLIRKGLIVSEEKGGVSCETGPNAILLSDLPVQNQRFSNLSEFPVLQMLYRQGMILPKHPNNTGRKPILVGSKDQLERQMEYIHRGNYGLLSPEELVAAGASESRAREILRLKLRFAFGRIRPAEDLLDAREIADGETEIRNGVRIRRVGLNVFEILHGEQSVSVDLNLGPNDDYEAPYELGFQAARRDYFSVIHSGDGDGWDPTRPCMSSILTFQGRVYLIDAGPNLYHSLTALGVGVNEIEGIFHTHAHDDHFNGLTVLLRAERRIKYFATPLVRASVARKLSALVSMGDGDFGRFFDVHDLQEGVWNSIDGLEVMPAFSPHPVETTVLYFRALWGDGYRTYAHLADIVSLDVLKRMVEDDAAKSGISGASYEEVKRLYAIPADLKKVDAGGGLIHGNPEDFKTDASRKVILSHSSPRLTAAQREVGSSSSFGTADVLISGGRNYELSSAFRSLSSYFPGVAQHEYHMMLNCPMLTFNPGAIIMRRGEENESVYLVLSGVLEYILADRGSASRMAAGSLVGELSGVLGTAARGTYRAISFVSVLAIPRVLYVTFLERNGILEITRKNIERRWFLQSTWLFGEQISCPLKNRIARAMNAGRLSSGGFFAFEQAPRAPELYVLAKGRAAIIAAERVIEEIGPGGFFGTEYVLHGKGGALRARALDDCELYAVSASLFEDIPIVQWKIRETYERRIRAARLAAA